MESSARVRGIENPFLVGRGRDLPVAPPALVALAANRAGPSGGRSACRSGGLCQSLADGEPGEAVRAQGQHS